MSVKNYKYDYYLLIICGKMKMDGATKMKEFIKKTIRIPKLLFQRFPVSMGLSILCSLVLAVFLESDIISDINTLFVFRFGEIL